MAEANENLIEALLDDVLDPDMLEDAITTAVGLLTGSGEDERVFALEREIAKVERERSRLVAAIASGGSLDGLLGALQQREARRVRLQVEHAALRSRRRLQAGDVARVRLELQALAGSWRHVLAESPTKSRAIVSLLLNGRVTITPGSKPKEWEMRGRGTLAGLFSKDFPLGMASPTIPSWNQIAPFIEAMRKLREAAGWAA